MDDNVEVFEDQVRVDDQYQIGEEQDREARGNIVGNVEIEAAPDTANQQIVQTGSAALRKKPLIPGCRKASQLLQVQPQGVSLFQLLGRELAFHQLCLPAQPQSGLSGDGWAG